MTQEELNTRLNELLDKYTRKELPFFEVVIAFRDLIEEYDSNLPDKNFKIAQDYLMDVLYRLRGIKITIPVGFRLICIKLPAKTLQQCEEKIE